MKIKMLRSALGSDNGHTTKHYTKDEVYEVSDALGTAFIDDKAAELAGDDAVATAAHYVEGKLYTDADGNVYMGAVAAGLTEVSLLPIDQLSDEERKALIDEGKLTVEGNATEINPVIEAKAESKAPKNKAVPKAPKNKAA